MRSLTPPPYLTDPRRGLDHARRVRALVCAALSALAAAVAAVPAHAAGVLVIRGSGAGHGIGMSQYGAEGLALHGFGYPAILTHYFQGTALGTAGPAQTVRVLIAAGRASFAGATSAAGTPLNPAVTYTVSPAPDGALTVRPASGGTSHTLAAPLTVSGTAPLQVPGQGTYRGSLIFSPDGQGGVQTVNAVGLDDYVRGVIAAEMPASWAPAALEAQTVAARTYAVTTTVNGPGYDLYDDARSQMYGGVGAETPQTDAAVGATSGQLVTYGGRPVTTYFFASSGGHTESIQNVWPGAAPEPWLQGVPDPYDDVAANPYHGWTVDMSLAAAQRRLSGLVRGSLVGIVVTRRGVSPRIIAAGLVGTGGSVTVSGADLQARLGLASTDATFTTIAARVAGRRLTGAIVPPPGPRGATVALQSAAAGWHTVARVRLGRGGTFTARVPRPGAYRVLDGRLAGPMVRVR